MEDALGKTKKIAISLPDNILKEVELGRKKSRETRSAFIKRALEFSMAKSNKKAMIERYVDGYRNSPETPKEIVAAKNAAVKLLAGEPWE